MVSASNLGCRWIIRSGERKGQLCGKQISVRLVIGKVSEAYCAYHELAVRRRLPMIDDSILAWRIEAIEERRQEVAVGK